MSSLGPIAELRHSLKSPVALAVGAAIGGAAPLTNYFTVHSGGLVWFDRGSIHFVGWSPLWILVVGSFCLSSKSVFRWGRNTFGDGWSAAALVAMLEGALLLAPVREMGYAALVFLILLNAAAYGSRLALRDQADRAKESAEKQSQQSLSVVTTPNVTITPIASSATTQRGTMAPRSVPAGLKPKALPEFRKEDELYTRAIDIARNRRSLSTETLRKEIACRHPTAAALIARLEQDGIVGPIDASDRGRRPVLRRAESA